MLTMLNCYKGENGLLLVTVKLKRGIEMLIGKELAPELVPNLFVCVLGIGTVFAGLICLIILCKIIGLCCSGKSKKSESVAAAPVAAPAPAVIENKQELIAAISAVVAEELGKDVSAIKITSFKKL